MPSLLWKAHGSSEVLLPLKNFFSLLTFIQLWPLIIKAQSLLLESCRVGKKLTSNDNDDNHDALHPGPALLRKRICKLDHRIFVGEHEHENGKNKSSACLENILHICVCVYAEYAVSSRRNWFTMFNMSKIVYIFHAVYANVCVACHYIFLYMYIPTSSYYQNRMASLPTG